MQHVLAPILKCANGCKNKKNLSFIGLGVILGYPSPFLGSTIPKLGPYMGVNSQICQT